MNKIHPLSRRMFLRQTVSASCAFAAVPLAGRAAATSPLRAAIIGHTGAGNYGHDLDVALNDVPGVTVVAVADPDAAGRAKAAQRSHAQRQYSDYREMIEKEKPQLVVAAPRWSDEHHAIGMAALGGGAHLLTEKPFTTTLKEADELLAIAERSKLKIAVAHQMRMAPSISFLRTEISKVIGDLIEIRSWGKQDARAGGEDMLVLGTHIFDMIRLFAGDAQWCAASVQYKGHDITRADARRVAEGIGPVAGDVIHAQFGFAGGVQATFTSHTGLRETLGHWGMELLGRKGAVRISMDVCPTVLIRKSGAWKPTGLRDDWMPMPGDPTIGFTEQERGFPPANRRVVEDLLAAIGEDRTPQCSGYNAMKAIEMVMAVYHAALEKTRVPLPLKDRSHPLA